MDKVNNILRENHLIKSELERLVGLIKENETKQQGFRLIEDAFLLAESIEDMNSKALKYLEEIFDIDKAVIFIDAALFSMEQHLGEGCERVILTDEKVLRYAYVEKRPYFGNYIDGLISEFHKLEPLGSYLIVPVMENGRIIASLNMYSANEEKFSGDAAHSDFVQQLSSRVAIALRKLHNIEVIKYQAQRDFLTGVYNKSMMHVLLDRYIQRYKREAIGFSFIITDIDHFKVLNERHGHIIGDNIMKELTDRIGKVLDDDEMLGRFGGDEFYIISNRITDIDVQAFFAKITEEVARVAAAYDVTHRIGISGGYIIVPRNIDMASKDAIDIVKSADAGLSYSKMTGRSICSGVMKKPVAQTEEE
ncbi:MAG: sensor domain-containing diguanylate cyclase [Deferribacteraceae bacterium]|jgi:diguanylate cyclase (GGDEF)-like protein|nr:sensor domain-containing diguanylate cyclase [Deferribacteraceae bacterium]